VNRVTVKIGETVRGATALFATSIVPPHDNRDTAVLVCWKSACSVCALLRATVRLSSYCCCVVSCVAACLGNPLTFFRCYLSRVFGAACTSDHKTAAEIEGPGGLTTDMSGWRLDQ
jgi:hypothetical protein